MSPRRSIPNAVPFLGGNEWKYVKECLDTNWVSSAGAFVERFEREMAAYVGVPHAIATVNGSAALAGAVHPERILPPHRAQRQLGDDVVGAHARAVDVVVARDDPA